jgi:Sulfotransferase family
MVAQIDTEYIKMRPWKLWSRMLSYALFEGRPLTTKGQWINPLVFALFGIEKKLPSLKRVTKPTFILGTGRSGTTILGIVLSMHREVGFLNEPKALWHSFQPDEDLIGSYARNAARYRLGAEDATPNRVQAAHRLFGAYLRATFSQRVVDKYPELIFRVPFVKALFPDAKFLFLVRNGWDTCHSIQGWSNRLGKPDGEETHDWWGADRRKWNLLVDQLVPEHADLAPHATAMRTWTKQTDMAAVEWIITMREGLRVLNEYPEDVLRVDYEQLCNAPSQVLSEILNFTNLDNTDDAFYKYASNTLTTTPAKSPFKLDDSIETIFCELMTKLNYGECK